MGVLMNIKQLLSQRRLRQVEVAALAGIDLATFNRFLNGWQRLPEKHVSQLAATLGIDENELQLRQPICIPSALEGKNE